MKISIFFMIANYIWLLPTSQEEFPCVVFCVFVFLLEQRDEYHLKSEQIKTKFESVLT